MSSSGIRRAVVLTQGGLAERNLVLVLNRELDRSQQGLVIELLLNVASAYPRVVYGSVDARRIIVSFSGNRTETRRLYDRVVVLLGSVSFLQDSEGPPPPHELMTTGSREARAVFTEAAIAR